MTSARHRQWFLIAVQVWGLLLAGCAGSEPAAPATAPSATLPTAAPTIVPGSAAEAAAVIEVVREFDTARRREEELVALLLLTPAAQQSVAASDLDQFAGSLPSARPGECSAEVDGDTATVRCLGEADNRGAELEASLLRIHDAWKIDGFATPGSE
jgi:hypothetical protein